MFKKEALPILVSLTTEPCAQATNILEIINNQPNGVKKEFGVCSKQLLFEDRGFGIKFIEWVHLLRILGAHKIHLYKEKVHNDTENVVEYLHDKGYIDIKPFKAPSNLNDTTFHTSLRRTLEINLLHDCLYRVKNLYEYIVVVDTDEVIMPMLENHKTWHDLVKQIKNTYRRELDAYVAKYVTYLHYDQKNHDDGMEEIPEHLYMLRHIYVNIQSFF